MNTGRPIPKVGDLVYYHRPPVVVDGVEVVPGADGIDIVTAYDDQVATLRDTRFLVCRDEVEPLRMELTPTSDDRCGTVAGQRAHRARHEQPCDPCRLALAAKSARDRRRKKERAA